ncbi:glycoside hydrolase family 32 protein [Ruoffia tabacinasalis]|uniref:glycoside hydrolase family 32 protein n=1 Tax=Ruoffia tabacinasalis TaxID=87458 RepID=UPI0030D230A3
MNLLEKANVFISENKHKIVEQFRPEFHLAPEYGWMNDPNGFVYFKGEYHLFYQSNPYDSKWDTMHWGHAKSKDLIEWEHLPVALAPDQPYDKNGCFSGSAIVVEDELVLMYTGVTEDNGTVSQVQCIATSKDGITFEKHINNPVIDQANLGELGTTVDFRDPKVFKRGDTFYSVVASKTLGKEKTQGQIFVFTSNDLVHWSEASVLLEGSDKLGNIWECPDLIELDGTDVLILSPMNMPQEGTQYQNINSSIAILGKMDWDNLSFEAAEYQEIDQGLDYYAPQTCLDDQGRRIIVAWQQMWGRTDIRDQKNHGWSGLMTLPRVLSIQNGKLIQTIPSEFYERLTSVYEEHDISNKLKIKQSDFDYIKIETEKDLEELSVTVGNESGEYFSISLKEELLSISRENVNPEIEGEEGYNHRRKMVISNLNVLEILVDSSSIEIFANGKAMSNTVYFNDAINTVEIDSQTNEIKQVTLSKIN